MEIIFYSATVRTFKTKTITTLWIWRVPFFRCEVGTFRKCKSRIGKATIRKILDRQEYLCLICFDNLRVKEYHIDHLVPISLGGSNQHSNLSAMCARCNLIKSSLVFKNETSMREYILKNRSNLQQ